MKQVHLNECDSTQDVLKEQLKASPKSSILVSCENQLKGRGRGDHTWSALPGSLCFSLSLTGHRIPSFTAIEVSLLAVRFFEHEGCKLRLKWPNDLFDHESKKCGGILIQTSGDTMLAGIGINLFSSHENFGGVYRSSFKFDKKSWASELAKFIEMNRYQDTDRLRLDWEERCFHLNEVVEIQESNETTTGFFRGLGEHGEALIETSDGMKRLYNGSLRWITSR